MGRWFLSFLFLAISPLDAMSLKSGESFPDLQFPSIHGGESVGVSSFSGKKLMLHLFASW